MTPCSVRDSMYEALSFHARYELGLTGAGAYGLAEPVRQGAGDTWSYEVASKVNQEPASASLCQPRSKSHDTGLSGTR